jgi:hypothetical protein
MADPIFHVGASAMCPHGGQISTVPGNTRLLVGGQPVATMADQFLVAGCVFTLPGPKPSPCVKVQWIVPATRVLAGGQPVILRTSTGLCQSPEQAPQGPPNVLVTQMKAGGT